MSNAETQEVASNNDSRIKEILKEVGVRWRPAGARFIRICADWRGDRSFDVAIAKVNGKCTDFGNEGETFDFRGLLEDKLKVQNIDGEMVREIGKYDPTLGNAIESENKGRIIKASNMWEKSMKFFSIPSEAMVRKQGPNSLQAHSFNVVRYFMNRGIPEKTLATVLTHQNIMRFSKNLDGSSACTTPYYMVAPDDKGNWTPTVVGVQKIMIKDGEKFEGIQANGDPLPEKFSVGVLTRDMNGYEVSAGLMIPLGAEAIKKSKVRLYFCEGFETGMSIRAATDDQAVMVNYSSGIMQNINPFYIEQLCRTAIAAGKEIELVMAIDNDKPDKFGKKAGIRAGMMAAQRLSDHLSSVGLLNQGVTISFAMPPTMGNDWLDEWVYDKQRTRGLLDSPTPFKSAEIVLSDIKVVDTPFPKPNMF